MKFVFLLSIRKRIIKALLQWKRMWKRLTKISCMQKKMKILCILIFLPFHWHIEKWLSFHHYTNEYEERYNERKKDEEKQDLYDNKRERWKWKEKKMIFFSQNWKKKKSSFAWCSRYFSNCRIKRNIQFKIRNCHLKKYELSVLKTKFVFVMQCQTLSGRTFKRKKKMKLVKNGDLTNN